ncbi:unnamed protein product [Heterotrigona itama]|uniref:Uncharacterized protein n=1 Tax=Heterotrigona itama TaxID=395501 RepID=A0A6V7HEL8_9HYME|nr:unnamed protein product [Heterotrigona itama]
MFTMIEPRSDRVTNTQTKHHCYQVIRTTRVHQSSRSSRMVTVQEKVIRSRLQLGYSTPTNFINRTLSRPYESSATVELIRVNYMHKREQSISLSSVDRVPTRRSSPA